MILGLLNEVSIMLCYLGENGGEWQDEALGCSLFVDPLGKKFGIVLSLTEIWYI